MTWTRLPQEFKNAPTLFEEALGKDSQVYCEEHPGVTVLQYVADMLLAAPNYEGCLQSTRDLLHMLRYLGYHVSTKKDHLCT